MRVPGLVIANENLLKDIEVDKSKWRYPDYGAHLEQVYKFLMDSIFGWWKK